MKQKLNTIVNRAVTILIGCSFFMSNALPVYADTKKNAAGSFGNSKLASGTLQLITDVTTWTMGASIAGIILYVLYYWFRKSGANDQEQSKWDKALKRAFSCVIGIGTSSAVVNLLLSYYQ